MARYRIVCWKIWRIGDASHINVALAVHCYAGCQIIRTAAQVSVCK